MKGKILIVDDDIDIAEAMSFILGEEGYDVSVIQEPSGLIDVIAASQPQLLILDVLMSGIDGRDVCAAVKARSDLSHIPVLMISAHSTASESLTAYGANDFLAKPFDSEVLIRRVGKLANTV